MKQMIILPVFLLVMGISPLAKAATETAVFAGGCFWCMESELKDAKGVSAVVSGYTGGTVENPTYEEVSSGNTGHYEAVKVIYDPEQVGYDRILDIYWSNIDPLDESGQFCDRGTQYQSAIFVEDGQHEIAEQSKEKLEQKLGQKIATKILPVAPFYPAEDYHQGYSDKNALRYKMYKKACGRDERLQEIWGED